MNRKTISITLLLMMFMSTAVLGREPVKVENITVTARKKAESMQLVPAGVTVFTDLDIEDKGLDSISDIAAHTPNFHNFDTGIMGLYTPAIRGKSGESAGSSVGLYIDGIPILSGSGFNDVMVDIERVEVLKGPQGTLYGKNTQIGAVNIISKSPGNTFAGMISGRAGENGSRRLKANVNVPLKKDLASMSVSALHHEHDGYLTYARSGNSVDHRDYDYGKFNLRLTPGDNVEIGFIASALEHDDGSLNMNITGRYAEMFGMPAPAPYIVESDLEGWNKSGSDMQVLKLDWDVLPGFSFSSVTSRRKYRSHYLNDWDFTALPTMHKEIDSTTHTYSQEFRGRYTGKKAGLMAGVYADKGKKHFQETNDITRQVEEDHTTRSRSLGLFMNADFNLSSRWTLSPGIRYDRDKGEYDEPSRSRRIDQTWEEVSPKITLSFSPGKTIMTYANVSKGYLSGGFNDHAGPEHPTTFDQETLWSYEAGVKTRFFNDRLQLNGTLFHMDITDYQVRIDASPEHNYTDNAAKATSSGFEAEARARLTRALSMTAGFGYTRAKFKEYRDAGGNYEGNRLPYAPEYSASIGGIYRHPSGVVTGLDITGYGKMYLNKENQHPRPAYAVVNAKVGYETERFDVYLYADNLFDKNYDTEGYFGGLYRVASPPREIGLKLSMRF